MPLHACVVQGQKKTEKVRGGPSRTISGGANPDFGTNPFFRLVRGPRLGLFVIFLFFRVGSFWASSCRHFLAFFRLLWASPGRAEIGEKLEFVGENSPNRTDQEPFSARFVPF